MPERIVKVLDSDPDLGQHVDRARMQKARVDVRAQCHELQPGAWREPDWPPEVRSGLGLLVLDGLLLRRVSLGGRFGAELLGAGDVLRPWQQEDAIASVSRSSGWRVLERSRVAVLDLAFARRIAPYPEIYGQLMARVLRRARHFAVIMAIVHQPKVEARVLMLLWHLADRFGIVRREGVLVPMRLTHTILADLLAARRPTVSGALGALQRSGQILATEEGFILHGSPPGELAALAEAG